jgi:hypothetical protein
MVPTFAGLTQELGLLRHELETEAKSVMSDIVSTRVDAKAAFVQVREKITEAKAVVADVKAFVAGVEGSNGGPTLADSSATSDQSPTAAPERVDVHGVSQA